jgi:hypothetical protein
MHAMHCLRCAGVLHMHICCYRMIGLAEVPLGKRTLLHLAASTASVQ